MSWSIIDPRMLGELTRFFYTDTVTLQANTPTRSESGMPVESWANVSGLVDLSCAIAATSAVERRTATNTYAESTHTIALNGHYPTISPTYRAVASDGNTYELVGVEHDSQGSSTYLRARLVGL